MHNADDCLQGDATPQPRMSTSRTVRLKPAKARAAFLDFHQQEYLRVIAFMMTSCLVAQDAEDAVQEAFIDLWRTTQRPGGWESIESPRGWIRTVALRKHYRIIESQKARGIRVPVVADLTEPIHSTITVETEFVRSCLRQLDPDTRIVMAFLVDGFKLAEVARHLNISDQKARDLAKKGRKALKVGLVALSGSNGRHANEDA